MINQVNLNFQTAGIKKIFFNNKQVKEVYFNNTCVYKYCNNITLSTFSRSLIVGQEETALTPSNVILCNTRPIDESSITTDNAGEDYKITSSITTTKIRYDEPVQLKGVNGSVPTLLSVSVNGETYDFPYHYTSTHNGLTFLSTFSVPISLGTCSDNTSIKAVSPLSTLQRIVTNSCLLKTVSMSYSSFSLATPWGYTTSKPTQNFYTLNNATLSLSIKPTYRNAALWNNTFTTAGVITDGSGYIKTTSSSSGNVFDTTLAPYYDLHLTNTSDYYVELTGDRINATLSANRQNYSLKTSDISLLVQSERLNLNSCSNNQYIPWVLMKPSSTTYATGSLSCSVSSYKVYWQTTGTLTLKQSTTSYFTPSIRFYQASSSSDYPSTAIYGYGIDKGGADVSVKYSAGSSSPSTTGTLNYGFISTVSWVTCSEFAPKSWGTDGLDYFLLTMYKRTASSSITTTSTQYIWNTQFWYEMHGQKYKTNISKLTRIKLAWGGDSSGDSDVYAWVSKAGSNWTVQLTNNLDIPVTFEYSAKKNNYATESFETAYGTLTTTVSAKSQKDVAVNANSGWGGGNYAKVRVVSLGPSDDYPREVTYKVIVLGSGEAKPIIHRV